MAVKQLGKNGRTRFYVDNVDVPFLQLALAEFRDTAHITQALDKTKDASESERGRFTPLGDKRKWEQFCQSRIDNLIETFRVEDKSYDRRKIVQCKRK